MKKTMLVLLMVVALAAMLIVPAYAEEATTPPAMIEVGGAAAFEEAVETLKDTNGYIVLTGDITEDITVSATAYVDLNGKEISGDVTIAEGATLKAFDSINDKFDAIPEGYGKITGTVTGDLARTMNTPKATYGHNYKYLAIKEADGYSFHRIYLAVKSVVLTPTDTGVNYRTVFKCNSVVAQYIATNGYGVRLGESDYAYEDVTVVPGGEENLKLARVNKILKAEDMADLEAAQAKAETAITASAIIKLRDGWSNSDEMTIASAPVSRSLEDQIAYANTQYHSLAEDQQTVMISMYNKYRALMADWASEEIGNVRLAINLPGPIFSCLCGAGEGEEHIGACEGDELVWNAWNSVTTLPTENGYWYLAEPVNLVDTWRLNNTDMDSSNVNLNLNGNTVTYNRNQRMMTVYRKGAVDANIVITDSSAENTGAMVVSGIQYPVTMLYLIDGENTSKATVNVYRVAMDASESNAAGMDGGAIRVNNGQTLNLYSVDLKGSTGPSGCCGSAISLFGGAANIYGGVVTGAAVGGNGGAIMNCQNGNVVIADATINGSAIPSANNATAIFNQDGGTMRIERSVINADVDSKANYGGAIANSHANSTLTIIDSTINGGKANYGGAIHNSGTLTVTNSEISAVKATNGGAIYNTGVLTLKDSTVTGAEADHGGALCVEKGTVTLDGGKIIGANVTTNGGAIRFKPSAESTITMTGTIIDVTGVTAGNAGGAINIDGYSAKATFTMESGEIKGGTATNGGAVVVQDTATGGRGIFNMKGGKISGGTSAGGDNVRVTMGGVFNMSGGTIIANAGNTAGVYLTSTGKMTISGTAKITGNKGCDLYLNTDNVLNIGSDWAGNGEEPMVVTMAAGTGKMAEGKDLTDTHAASFTNAAGVVLGYDGSLYIGEAPEKPNATDPSKHCLCGANNGEEHIGTCDGKILTWTAWTATDSLPATNGNYYLTEDVKLTKLTASDATWRLNNTDMDNSDLKLDLNGKTIESPDGKRVMTIYRKGTAEANIVITDSSAGHTGKIISMSAPGASLVYLIDGGDTNATLNVYRATLDASGVTAGTDEGGAIRVNAGQTLNLYGAVLKGNITRGSGSAITIYNGTVNIKDGSVVSGGGVASDVLINGGTIFNYDGTVTITDSTVNGTAISGKDDSKGNGSAIYNRGTLTMVNATIKGAGARRGGAVHIDGGVVTMEGGKMTGGNTTSAGTVLSLRPSSEASFTMSGDAILDGTGTSAYGGATVNIDAYSAKATFAMNGGKIIGGTTTFAGGGAVCIQDTNTGNPNKAFFVMNAGEITGGIGKAMTAGHGGANVRITTGGNFTMNGGTITGGTDNGTSKAHGVMLTGSGSMTIAGSAKITGNGDCDLYLNNKNLTIGADWKGNGSAAMVIKAASDGAFANAGEGLTFTDAFKAYFTCTGKTIAIADNKLTLQ